MVGLLRSSQLILRRTGVAGCIWRGKRGVLFQWDWFRGYLMRARRYSTTPEPPDRGWWQAQEFVECSTAAKEDSRDFVLIPGFVSPHEEESLLQEVSRSFRRVRYQYSHWDQAIEGYRETEKTQWPEQNQPIITRLREVTTTAVAGKTLTTLPGVHVLDLAQDGYIKPHTDSIKFCGEVIAGVSLLSPSVMRLEHGEDTGRWICALLPQRSLYIMHGVVRYKYTHALLSQQESLFRGEMVIKDRRVSVICRTEP